MTQEEVYQRRLSALAHELRSPLSVICMGLQVMQSVRKDDEQFNTVHKFMESAGKELSQLIDSMATLNGMENALEKSEAQ